MPSRAPMIVLAVAALLAGCGGSKSSDAVVPPPPQPTAKPQDFPAVGGKTLGELQRSAPAGPVFAPSVSILDPGTDRVAFALFDRARRQLTGAQVALYTSKVDGTAVHGPYIARDESLAVKTQFRSQTTAQDPDAAKSLYVADLPLKRGKLAVLALVRLDGRLVSSSPYGLEIGAKGAQPPRVGEKAIRVHTPTLTAAGGDESKIDTRVPGAPALHKADLYDVLGKKPVVLVFATPQLCQSRVCGPVVDIVYQVSAAYGDRAAFIHNEVYNQNEVAKGFRPQLGAYKLPTEPWTFVIDRDGIVRARFEGALSVGELERAVARVVK
jgi:hypothetical protein